MKLTNKIFSLQLVAIFFYLITPIQMLSQAMASSEPVAPVKPSVYQNPVFYALVFVAIVLLIFIMQLGKVLGAVASTYKRGNKSVWDNMKSVVLIIGFGLMSTSSMNAQVALDASTNSEPEFAPILDFLHHGFGSTAINALVLIIILELLVVVYYLRMIRLFVVKEPEPKPYVEGEVKTSVFWDKMNASVAIEQEATVMTDHDYDGIRELDNALPPWWKYGFYLTIVWAFVYLGYYHAFGKGALSAKEYANEMESAQVQLAAYKARAANMVDESSVVMLADDASIAKGAAHYTQFCVVCHGKGGEGLVGPNLTDDYWLHGGDIKDLFKTVKYGVQGKGMKSWQQELSPVMMAEVVSYIKTLKGTNPPNAKAPEGELYVEKSVGATDSVAVTTKDSPTVAK